MTATFDFPGPSGPAERPFGPATKTLVDRFIQRWMEHRARRQLAQLEALDERMLRDMGITREDVYWARNAPLSENAGHQLNRIARRAD